MPIGVPIERYAQQLATQVATTAFSPTTTIASGTRAVLCAGGTGNTATKTISSVADDAGNVWAVDATGSGSSGQVWAISFASCSVVTPITTSNVITITWGDATSTTVKIWVQEVSGLPLDGSLDKTASGGNFSGGVTSFTTSATAVLSRPNEIVFVGAVFSPMTWTKGAGYSDVTTPTFADAGGNGALEYKIVSSTAAVSGTGSVPSAAFYEMILVTYQSLNGVAFIGGTWGASRAG